jgi:FSR family fosmidomycin resistance protein-like MFS transporter
VLVFAHYSIDMFGGMLAPLLPAVRDRFDLSLSKAVFLLSLLSITGNFIQIAVGHFRSHKRKPLLLPLGIFLATAVCFLGFLPQMEHPIIPLSILVCITGTGIALAHPEALRAVFAFRRIASTSAMTAFMAAGNLGFASGGFLATLVISVGSDSHNLKNLIFLSIFATSIAFTIIFSGLKLKAHSVTKHKNIQNEPGKNINFWPIWAIAVPMGISTVILVSLVPTRLDELGFKLSFGGFTTMLLGAGITSGSFFWAWVSKKIQRFQACITGLILSVPVLTCYLFLMEYQFAAVLMAVAGFLGPAVYPLVVTASGKATGLKLGQRMAISVGGVWGLANVVLMILGPVAEKFGTDIVLKFAPAGYILSASVAFVLLITAGRKGLLDVVNS